MGFFPKKILLAADGSEDSVLAIQAASDLCRETGSELHVLHVGLLSPWVQPDALSDLQYDRLRQEAQGVLDEQVRKVQTAGATVEGTHLRMGRADVEVIKLSEELRVGLIVVGSKGLNTIERLLLGSDAEAIVRHAPCPVMVVRPEAYATA